MSDRDNQKKIEKAQKESEKGKRKEIDNLEGSLKWVSNNIAPYTFFAMQKTVTDIHDAYLAYSKTG